MLKRLAFLAALIAPTSAFAASLDVIVDRRGEAVEVFVSLEATDIPAVFGNSADFIAPPGEVVAYEVLREGTWDQGDAMIAGSTFTVNGAVQPLEAMSMMVHPKDAPMPFRSIADAYLAMSVCNGFAPGTVPTVDILHAYAGYIAYPVDGAAALSLTLQNSDFVSVSVREMTDGRVVSEQSFELAPSGTIALAPPSVGPNWQAIFMALMAVGGGLLVMCYALHLQSGAKENGRTSTRTAAS